MESVFGQKPNEITINYLPHQGQEEVSEKIIENFTSSNPAFIVEIIASRGWGKTLFMVASVLVPFLEQRSNLKVMWVAPTYSTALSPIEDVFKGIDEVSGERWINEFDSKGNRIWEFTGTKTGPVLRWWNGSTVSFKSADAPDTIVSRGYNLIIIDEAALIPERVFQQQILGTARKQGIKIFAISSPRGKSHWTYKVFVKGQDKKDTQYLSFSQPYYKNPHFNKALIKAMDDLPEWLKKQEYLAEFLDSGEVVFSGLDSVIVGPEISFSGDQQEWEGNIGDCTFSNNFGTFFKEKSDRRYVVGLDLAKSVDFTVLCGMDVDSGEVVFYKRFNKVDYRTVLKITAEVCKKLNSADLIFDATGVGAGLADMLNNYDINAYPFVFTNETKNELVNKLAGSIQHAEIKLPNIVTMKNELSTFTYSVTKTGKVSYSAPAGFHDDTVMALGLANWYRKENSAPDDIMTIDNMFFMDDIKTKNNLIEDLFDDNDD